jgi:predicted nucleic acid-binding protein
VPDPFFDTNILIDWLNDNLQAIAELSRYKRPRISRVVWTEILAGEALETRDIVRELIAPFDVVEIDARIATAAAEIRYRSRMKLMDAYILATAQVNGAILITRNTKDFPAEMPGIRVPYTVQQKAQ